MTNPTPAPLLYPNGKPIKRMFTAYLNNENRMRLRSVADFMAMAHMPVNPAGLLEFMLTAAEDKIIERMSE